MSTVELSDDTFSTLIDSNRIAIIDIWAEWCAPCKRFAPIFQKLSNEYPDILFAKVNAEDSPRVVAGLNIRGIPSVVAVRDSYFVYSMTGFHTEEDLRELISNLVNMENTSEYALPT